MKKILLSTVLIGIVFSSACSNEVKEFGEKTDETETISVGANYLEYDEESSLFKETELVVIAEVNTDFEEREHFVTYFQSETAQEMNEIEDYYTKTPITIKKVLKTPEGSNLGENSELMIIEPISLIDDENGKRILTTEHYKELEKDNTYVLYLNKNTDGEYSVINMNNGRFNLDKEEEFIKEEVEKEVAEKAVTTAKTGAQSHEHLDEHADVEKVEIHDTMKGDVLKKFAKEIEEVQENK
ncbi:hypothetical protein ACWF7H_23345 [Peribacillus butanolivorans]|uniref:hypothetical protein n=1 Tax=Peribacillus butanolivorans TaxID=421767 RepID=UPI0036CE5F81